MEDEPTLSARPSSSAAQPPTCTAFVGQRCIASGPVEAVARKLKPVADRGVPEEILVFDDRTGDLIEIDLGGTLEQVIERLVRAEKAGRSAAENPQKRGPGRPKLGVLAREVTLLPAQWDWLDGQPGGASAALRRLVYEAKRTSSGKDRARQAQEAVYRFMTAMAGDFPGFEEALRAFYRRDHQRFASLIAPWPKDIRSYLEKLVAAALASQRAEPDA